MPFEVGIKNTLACYNVYLQKLGYILTLKYIEWWSKFKVARANIDRWAQCPAHAVPGRLLYVMIN